MGMQQEGVAPIDESFFNGLMEQILAASNTNDLQPSHHTHLQSPAQHNPPSHSHQQPFFQPNHKPIINPFSKISQPRRATADPPLNPAPRPQAMTPPPPVYGSTGGGGTGGGGGGGQKQKRGLEVTPSVVERDDAAARRNTAASLGGHLPTGFSRGADVAPVATGAFQDPNT